MPGVKSKIRISFDMFVLGQGVQTGVYRVCDAIYSRFARQPGFSASAVLRDDAHREEACRYLSERGLSWPWIGASDISRTDVLFLPFLEPWEPWSHDDTVLKVFVAYDLIGVLQPDFFEAQLADRVKRVYDGLPRDCLVFCISENTRRDFLAYRPDIPADNVAVIPLAADETFTPCADRATLDAVRARYGIPSEAAYLLSVATLEKRKNLQTTVAGFAHYVSNHPDDDVYLVLAGMKGWKLESLEEELRQLGKVRDRIVMTGFVQEKHLAALYSGAAAFVYMSRYEGFGLPPLEAMACGVPVITSNTSSLPEVVGDAGIMLAPDDVAGLSQAMERLLTDAALRSRMAAKGIARARQFSWDLCVDIMSKAIRERMQLRPKLSIITICYNEPYLEDTCRSVIAQTWRDFEWIVVDGGSTEAHCRRVLERYRPTMRYCISERDNGRYDAMNKGLKLATGQYVLFLNAGDYLVHAQVLEHVFAYKPIAGQEAYTDLHFDADIMYGEVLAKETGMMPWPLWTVGPQRFTKEFFANHSLPHQATFIRRGLFQLYGMYDTNFKYAADYEWFMRVLLRHGASSCYIPMPISVYNFEGVSSSSTAADAPHIKEAHVAYIKYTNSPDTPAPSADLQQSRCFSSIVRRIAPRWIVKRLRRQTGGQ